MSNRQLTRRRIIGHAGALLFGIALAWGVPKMRGDGGDGIASATPAEAAHGDGGSPKARGVLTRATSRDYEEAWRALLARPVPQGKPALKRRLLRDWAEVDLSASLAAALRDQEDYQLSIFKDQMIARPEEIWAMVRENRFGWRTGELLDGWIEVAGESAPMVVMSHLPEMEKYARRDAVTACVASVEKRPAELKTFVESLGKLPDSDASRAIWKDAGEALAGGDAWPQGTTEEIIARLKASGVAGERRLLAHGLAGRLGAMEDDPTRIREVFDSLPDDVRKDTILSVLANLENGLPFIAAGDWLMEQGDWAAMAGPVVTGADYAGGDESVHESLTAWALALPEREETVQLYRKLVQRRSATPEIREWLEQLPRGWKRDHALIALIQSLHSVVCTGPEGWRAIGEGKSWAAARIEDPALQEEARRMGAAPDTEEPEEEE